MESSLTGITHLEATLALTQDGESRKLTVSRFQHGFPDPRHRRLIPGTQWNCRGSSVNGSSCVTRFPASTFRPRAHAAPPAGRWAEPRWRRSWSTSQFCVWSPTSASTGFRPGPPTAVTGTNPEVLRHARTRLGLTLCSSVARCPSLPLPLLGCHLARLPTWVVVTLSSCSSPTLDCCHPCFRRLKKWPSCILPPLLPRIPLGYPSALHPFPVVSAPSPVTFPSLFPASFSLSPSSSPRCLSPPPISSTSCVFVGNHCVVGPSLDELICLLCCSLLSPNLIIHHMVFPFRSFARGQRLWS